MKHYTKTQQKIFDKISPMTIPCGLGTKENACTIAAINLALTGKLTDNIPECCSEVISRWIIVIQDAIPTNMRNSERYKMLVPYIAGTGRSQEKEAVRLKTILDWMWNTVLPSLQVLADKNNFGRAWQNMLAVKTAGVASKAANAAASYAAAAANASAYAATYAGYAATYAGYAGYAATSAAYAASAAAYASSASNDIWETFDPISLLEKLILVGEPV